MGDKLSYWANHLLAMLKNGYKDEIEVDSKC